MAGLGKAFDGFSLGLQLLVSRPLRWPILLAIVSSLLLSGLPLASAYAQIGEGYDLTWWTIDGGGVTLTGGGSGGAPAYSLSGTVGQPDPGPALNSDGYTLVGGFWPAVLSGSSDPGSEEVYLPIIVKNW